MTGTARSYKCAYKARIEERMAAEGLMGRVHTEVSVKQGNRKKGNQIDVTVFNQWCLVRLGG